MRERARTRVRRRSGLRRQREQNARQSIRWVCVRGRLSEDIVERAAVAGVRQYVIVGAGLDSLAYRRADVLERMRPFEVDHPVSQWWKRRCLKELGMDPPASRRLVPLSRRASAALGALSSR